MEPKEGNIEKKRRYDNDTLLTYECKKGNIEKVKYLIDHGKNINKPNKDGDTPLLISIKRNNIELFLYLLSSKDIDINKKSNYGLNPLLVACYFKNKDLVDHLLNHNASIDISDSIKNLPLHIASYLNVTEIIDLLRNKNNMLCEESNLFGDTPKKISEKINNKANDSLNERLNESSSTSKQDEMIVPKQKFMQFNNFFNEINRSICLIKTNNVYGTGFFIEIPIPSKQNPLRGLMTSNCILNEKKLTSSKSFTITMACNENEEIEIQMKNQGFVFTSELIDVTFIELSGEIIKKYKPSFLRSSKKDASNNESILIIQYPNLKFSFAHGTIQSTRSFDYYHNVLTNFGSSGAPLLNENFKVVGVHKSKRTFKILGNEEEDINVKVAVKFSEILYALKVIYNNGNVEGFKRAKRTVKELSESQLKELSDYGLQLKFTSEEIEKLMNESTNNYEKEQLKILEKSLFYCTFSKKDILFYRTNYAWYVTILSEENNIPKYSLDNIKKLNWTPLISNSEKLDRNIMSKINGREYILITWLKLTELMYL